MGKEIERKFLIKELPANLSEYPFHELTQGYLNTDPVVRVRKEDDTYYLTSPKRRCIPSPAAESRRKYHFQEALSDPLRSVYNRAGRF